MEVKYIMTENVTHEKYNNICDKQLTQNNLQPTLEKQKIE